jgi:hypothetical protein
MNDHVRVSLVFSRSGQKLSVRLPREVAQSARTSAPTQLSYLIEQAQQNKVVSSPEPSFVSS